MLTNFVQWPKHFNMIMPLKYKLDRRSLENMYKPFVGPVMEYGIVVWGGTYETSLANLVEINIKAMRIILVEQLQGGTLRPPQDPPRLVPKCAPGCIF